MRLLNRSAGRISRHRRGPLAGLVVLLLGLLLTGGLYTAFSPAQAEEHQPTRSSSPRAASSSSSAARSATARTARASPPPATATRSARRSSASAPPPSTSRSAPAACRWPAPASRPRARSRSTTRRRSPRSRRTSPRWAPARPSPSESDYSIDGLSEEEREEAIVRGGQIFLTNCTACHNFTGAGGAMPRGGYAPHPAGRRARVHLRGDADRPADDAHLLQRQPLPRGEARRHRLPRVARGDPEYGGFGLGGLGPVSEGLFAWVLGIGGLVGFAVWIAAHSTRSSKVKEGAEA